ncbi:laminin subunit beta-4 isoform X2 [Xenopus laevis]|uniref:Laminin subunit beta-1 n=2 Tax=Xenopus laevis TaxID=8355 RepID=A0A8J0URD8_XENLA|nr:laminin subunit beta-4 isoform X2 [Xenopus laevis]
MTMLLLVLCFSVSKLQNSGEMFFLQLIYFITALSLVKLEENCENRSCHPVIGDLLLGRSRQLSASSTCGLDGPQKYCIISYLEDDQKCFQCDSRDPYDPYGNPSSHLIENVITTFEPEWKNKWWQSENGVDHVSIRLDLETLFQFSHLVLTFKTFRPSAMLVERSRDFGKTWKVFKYFAHNCATAFPAIPQGHADEVGDVICDTRYSDIEPSTEGEVVLKALDPSFHIEDPYDPFIQDLITITNLRINFTKLHTLGDAISNQWQDKIEEKYYYAVYEMIVRGNCFCNGHARQCAPLQNTQGDVLSHPDKVHGKCVCQHNTDGVNCEKCKEFYNDTPWAPAVAFKENACRKCNCNGHSEKCHFDMAVYLANNRNSGGVCDDCQDNTMGNHCELCKPYFYRNPLQDTSDPYACIPCDCDPDGTQGNGLCQSQTNQRLGTLAGACLCKENVEGIRCDQCNSGYFGLSANDPLGCQYCNCNPFGSLKFSTCDTVTGECQCQQFATGRYCEECIPGYWGLGNSVHSCTPCNCDIGGALSDLCSQSNGQCDCRPNLNGRHCNQPKPGHYIIPLDYYFYEAENALLLTKPENIVNVTPMPKCKDYFEKQGIEFRFENGRIILTNMTKQSLTERTHIKEIFPFSTNGFAEVVLRQPTTGSDITWTGPGFVRVLSGTGLRFTVNNIPYPMEFVIAIRYEPETLEDWTARIVVNSPKGEASEHCRNSMPLDGRDLLFLSATSRLALLNTSICLTPEIEYSVDVYLTQESNSDSNSYLLIDSLGLIPKIASVKKLCNQAELEEYDNYNCIEMASEMGTEILPDVCERLIVSMSARIHTGAAKCNCNADGSLSPICSKFGGWCDCKPNVAGRCCDRCAVGSFGFGSAGCKECNCDTKGSVSPLCDQVSGQCVCRGEIHGRRCDSCLPGYYGFPNCQPCQCNGNSEICDPVSGVCLDCKGFTNGTDCERCLNNYYGNPTLGHPCRPCMCPDSPNSNQYFAHSCHQDPDSLKMVCNCLSGYTGDNCDSCPPGFYGNMEEFGGHCLACQCNNNIDRTDPESCDKVTGECLKCLHNTYGANCESCLPGYFGSPLLQNCRKCVCNPLGTNVDSCSVYEEIGECVCNKTTGQCPCLRNVIGTSCDKCAYGYWGMSNGSGCQPCDCYLNNSLGVQCNQFTGQCLCKPKYTGKKCDECEENHYPDAKYQCLPCKCNLEGTIRPMCDKITGSCNCRPGVTGRYCDQCAPKFKQQFPECPRCHLCFDPWDSEVTSLSEAVHGLIRLAANIDPKRPSQIGCDIQISILQDKLSIIENFFKSPFISPQYYSQVKSYYDTIRQKVRKVIISDFEPFNKIPRLNKTITLVEKEVDNLFKELERLKKIKEGEKAIKKQVFLDAFDKISKQYSSSVLAGEKLRNVTRITQAAAKTRKHVLTILDNQEGKHKQYSEMLKKMKSLDISKMNEMVCGTVWDFPCDVAPCGGALCRDKSGKRKCGGPNCNGALPLANDALKSANNTDMKLRNISINFLEAEKQINSIRYLAEDTKIKASQLNKTLNKAMGRLEADKMRAKELIKNVKDFLLDSTISPVDIENVVNQILAIKLPAAPYDLIDMLSKIKKYCDSYKENKKSLQNQLEEVQKLNQRAKEARKVAENLPNTDEIWNALKMAEGSQKKTSSVLKSVNNDLQDIKNKLSEAKAQADLTEDKMKAINDLYTRLETKIAELQDKMLKNRNSAAKAENDAKAAMQQAIESEKSLSNLKEKYQLLKEKLKKREIPPEILERLQQLKKEAETLSKEIDNKFQSISDLEEKIDELNKTNQEKANQLIRLEKQAIKLKNDIVTAESTYSTCKA